MRYSENTEEVKKQFTKERDSLIIREKTTKLREKVRIKKVKDIQGNMLKCRITYRKVV